MICAGPSRASDAATGASAASLTPRGGIGKAGLLAMLSAILALAACSDLRLNQRQVDPGVRIESHAAYRFINPALADAQTVSAQALALDHAVRAAIDASLQQRGYRAAAAAPAQTLLVDYVLSESSGVNQQRLDSPSDYLRSWRNPGGIDDGTGSMDHTTADAPFFRELSIRVLLIPETTGRVAWEGIAVRSLPQDHVADQRFLRLARTMVERLLRALPNADVTPH